MMVHTTAHHLPTEEHHALLSGEATDPTASLFQEKLYTNYNHTVLQALPLRSDHGPHFRLPAQNLSF